MPYIKQTKRSRLQVQPTEIRDAGELNYMVTKAALRHVNNPDLNKFLQDVRTFVIFYKQSTNLLNYQFSNDVVGALVCAGLELERRLGTSDAELLSIKLLTQAREFYKIYVAPYEDLKIKENGDVFNVKETS